MSPSNRWTMSRWILLIIARGGDLVLQLVANLVHLAREFGELIGRLRHTFGCFRGVGSGQAI